MTTPPRSAYIAWIAVCVIWGTTYLGIRVSLETIPPNLMSGIRWTIAGLLVAAVLLARGHALPEPRAWPGLALLSVLMIGIGNGFVVWAEQYVPSGLTAVVLATSPFWTVPSMIACMPASSPWNVRAVPENCSPSWPVIFATAPSGARLPYNTTR